MESLEFVLKILLPFGPPRYPVKSSRLSCTASSKEATLSRGKHFAAQFLSPGTDSAPTVQPKQTRLIT
jgi:hypothetical protein